MAILNQALMQARNTLELANKKSEESEVNLQLTIQAANLALWSVGLDTQTLFLSAQHRAMFGFPAIGEISVEQVMNRVEPADLPIVDRLIADASTGRQSVDIQYRIKNRITKERKYIKAAGTVIKDVSGKAVK